MTDKKKNTKVWLIIGLIVLVIGMFANTSVPTSTESVGGVTSGILSLTAFPIIGPIILAIITLFGTIFAFKYGQLIVIILILYLSIKLISLFKK